jgi:hypothetical protein
MAHRPEPWLRGPLPGLSAALQPVATALIGALEDLQAATDALTPEQLWRQPGGAASVGFHLLHLSGSTDRLFTYARGEPLSDAQRGYLASERALPAPPPTLEALLDSWEATVNHALEQLGKTADTALDEYRAVGRAQLPSTVRGLLFHAAEHAQRHAGQIITTAKVIRGLGG